MSDKKNQWDLEMALAATQHERDRARRELCDMLARERSDENFHAVVKARGWDYLIEEQDR